MYTPNDVEILDAYEDFVAEVGHLSDCSAAWLEAFKRGMRFNPNASQSIHAIEQPIATDACTCDPARIGYLDRISGKICTSCLKTRTVEL